jgi:16S rRNA (guanine527-N7)-methyltransferase
MASRADLLEVLAHARRRGFLGPGDPADHLEHAFGFVDVVEAVSGQAPDRIADLGTGGGVPGLVLALEWTGSTLVLVDSSLKRAIWLTGAVADLGLTSRVEVCSRRAEELAHEPDRRESFDLVTARSFAAPAVTAEIASGLLAVGGLLVVSEPPEPVERWPEGALARLGLGPAATHRARGAGFACMRKVDAAPANLPRLRGRAAKTPLW